MSHAPSNLRPAPDAILVQVAEYALRYQPQTGLAVQTARLALMDALGCAFEALQYPACTRLLGPIVPNAEMPSGARVPGTAYRLDPVRAAFNLGAMIRWLDYNDTWLAAEWGHPSDNLGGILMLADWLSRSGKALTVRDVLEAQIVAYEVQGVLALENAFNRAGLDHVLLVKMGTTAAAARLLGLAREQTINALSNAWVDGQALRTYRHAPNTGSRKSWAAGDASARGVWLALLAQRGEMGYPSALTAPVWGFQDASFRSQPVRLGRELGSYVMENILFKVRFPAEFHAQTAVEAAIQLHPQAAPRLEQIERVVISTQESALRIIDKTGPLYNPADRDHCIQYMTAIGLIFGTLGAVHYEDATAADPRIDALREKMICVENPQYSRDYLDPEKRSIGNAVQVFFRDGISTDNVAVEYPIGHRRRRAEAAPLLYEKFFAAARSRFGDGLAARLLGLFRDDTQFEAMPVQELVSLMAIEG